MKVLLSIKLEYAQKIFEGEKNMNIGKEFLKELI